MKQTWLLSCLGSLGKRRKNLEGKLNAMFSRETREDCHLHHKNKNIPPMPVAHHRCKKRTPVEHDDDDDDDAAAATTTTAENENREEEEEMLSECEEEEGEVEEYTPLLSPPTVREEVDRVVEKEMLPPKETTRGRVGKRFKNKRRQRREVEKMKVKKMSGVLGKSMNQEIFANAKINSKGNMSANVGRKYI